MPILNLSYVDKDGVSRAEWKLKQNFHILTKTTDSTGKKHDLVFLSGIMYFDYGTLDESWVPDPSLIISFKDLRWWADREVQVAPVVSLAAISNIQTDETENIGWSVNSTKVDFIPGPTGSKSIRLICEIAITGIDTHLEKVSYYVAATGDLHK